MHQAFVRGAFNVGSLAALLVPLTGCVTPNERGDETRWQPQALYLNRSPHPSLYVEVEAVAGTEPSDAALEQLRQFLTKYCDKPGGIRIVRDRVIPRTEARGLSHDALACRYLNGPPVDSSNSPPAFIYVLYYDSALCQGPMTGPQGPIHKHLSLQHDFGWVKMIRPHVHLMPFPGAIFIDHRYLAGWPRSLEGLILTHEAGHVLGLTQNERHGVNNHCTNSLCIMQPELRVDLPRALFSAQKTRQTNFCELCQADLMKGRTMAPATNLVFLGPVMVRSEEGYCVATLPGELKIFSGQLTKLDVPEFLKQMHEDGENPESFAQLHTWTHNWADLLEPREDWAKQITSMEKAKADKLQVVRKASTNAVATLQCVLAQAYLTGEGLTKSEDEAAKWFRKAAESGYAEAQNRLAWCYAQGKGVAKDEVEAYQWFSLAAEKGDKEARKALENLAGTLTRQQIQQGQERAAAFPRQSAGRPELVK